MASYPTPEEIEAARTPAGGWTRAQLRAWGVPWPPPKGWKKLLERAAYDPTIVIEFPLAEELRSHQLGLFEQQFVGFEFEQAGAIPGGQTDPEG